MIASFHPCYEGDVNIICAGREPDAYDLNVIRSADAVILNQGCGRSLFAMADQNCRHVFPNYHARFGYPGKIGQSRLFQELSAPYPETVIFLSAAEFYRTAGHDFGRLPFGFPLVFKFDWGGQGDTVHLAQTPDDLRQILDRAETYEKTGQNGFIIQKFVPHGNRSLRVAVIGETNISYWRVRPSQEPFYTNLSRGAYADADSDPDRRETACEYVSDFCRRTGVNLAGFDLIFPENDTNPLFLEINYFFGRTGLGGSDRYYTLLKNEIDRWITNIFER